MTEANPLRSAIRSLRLPLALGAIGLALAGLLAALLLRADPRTPLLAATIPLLLVVVQALALERAARPGANGVAWIAGSYPVRIALLGFSLHLPKALGVDVRIPAIIAILAVLAQMIAEAAVLLRMPRIAVDAPTTAER